MDKILSKIPVFTMILYTYPIQPDHLKALQDYGSKHLTPLFAVHSVGLYSYFHISLPGSFPVVDTHPDETATTDLRLLSPWPELQAFAGDMTKEIDTMDNHDHGHLPYVVILLHFLEKWKETHGNYPTKYSEKTQFRQMVAAGARKNNPEGGEENFDEAVAAVVKTVVLPSVPSSLKEVFDHRHEDSVSLGFSLAKRKSGWLTLMQFSRLGRRRAFGSSPTPSRHSIRSTAVCHCQGMCLT